MLPSKLPRLSWLFAPSKWELNMIGRPSINPHSQAENTVVLCWHHNASNSLLFFHVVLVIFFPLRWISNSADQFCSMELVQPWMLKMQRFFNSWLVLFPEVLAHRHLSFPKKPWAAVHVLETPALTLSWSIISEILICTYVKVPSCLS